MDNKVAFIDNSEIEKIIDDIDLIEPCFKNKGKLCYSTTEENNGVKNGKLLIPKNNLFNNNDNSKLYFHFLTDTIIRKNDFYELHIF